MAVALPFVRIRTGPKKFHLSPLQATTAVAETTVVADIRGLTVFSAIAVVACTFNTFLRL